MSVDLEQTLHERGSEYGDFAVQFRVSQQLKAVMAKANNKNHRKLSAEQMEALEMIAHKLSRLCCGNPDHFDTWHDIAGYATLVAQRIEEDSELDAPPFFDD